MNLIELQNKIHLQNIAHGWWDSSRSFSKINNLNISEVSEAVEADRKELMDSKLKKYKGVPVEAADACIRSFDFLASIKNENFDPSPSSSFTVSNNLNDLHFLLSYSSWCFSKAWECSEISNSPGDIRQYLVDATHALFAVISMYGHDPVELMIEKIEYNQKRLDHKKENRQGLPGQKKY